MFQERGLKTWINANASGKFTRRETADRFVSSQEFKNRYGSNVSDAGYVTLLYNNVLERDPDANGLANYTGKLQSGEFSRARLLNIFSESAENQALFTDVTGLSWSGWLEF